MADLKNLKGISEADKKLLAEAEEWLGAEPTKMGPIKNLFWGNFKEDYYFPYPVQESREQAECDQLLARLTDYLKHEHPAIEIDQEQEIPRWVIDKLFGLGVLGMTIGKEYGGLGLGITSYNRVLERIGMYCGSTAVLVSAHQSHRVQSGHALRQRGAEEAVAPALGEGLGERVLPLRASRTWGATPVVRRRRCTKTEDGNFYIINGEKKWATSGAISGLFTVMARRRCARTARARSARWSASMDGRRRDLLQKNRSKCGIRGTWQARIRFHNVRVPKENLLGKEGRGLQIALSCLNYGRCTLSAGMLGGAKRAMDQSIKWTQTRFQFQAPGGPGTGAAAARTPWRR
jgi:acyl-CoA dehydrogenase family protein 9